MARRAVASPLAFGVPGLIALLAGVAANATLLLAAFLALFAWAAVKGRWRMAYTLLVAGPGTFGVLCGLHVRFPAQAPAPPPFPLVSGLGSIPSALGLALALVLAWTQRRSLAACMGWSAFGVLLVLAPAAAGTETLDNCLVGAGIGLAGAIVGVLAGLLLHGVLEPEGRLPGALGRACAATTSWADRRLWGNTRLLWGFVALGILCRIPGLWTWSIGPDASRYAAMADALNRHGEFLMPWGDIYSPGTGAQFSHHFPPLYPALLAVFYRTFGFSEGTTRLASMLLALGAIAVTYACTRDLYGKTKGVLAAAVVSLSPVLVMTTNKAYAENLLLILFVLAMWAILRSLHQPWFIVLAGLFAGLGYLTKSSMGYFFIVAGLGGLAWRLYWKGPKVLRDPAYLAAITAFGGMVAWWAWRNFTHFGTWSSSTHLDAAYAAALAHPLSWANLTVYSFLVMFGLGYLAFMAVLPWLPQLRRIPRLESEHDSGLWLSIGLPLLLTVAIDAALWLYEGDFFLHNVRYVSFAIVPLVWLLMLHAKPSKQTWAAVFISFAILLAGSLYYTLPNRPLNTQVADEFGALVHDGDSITFVGDNDVYRYYFAVTHDGTQTNHTVRYEDAPTGLEATSWLVVRGDATLFESPAYGYVKVLDRSQGSGLLAERYTVWQHV